MNLNRCSLSAAVLLLITVGVAGCAGSEEQANAQPTDTAPAGVEIHAMVSSDSDHARVRSTLDGSVAAVD